MAIERTRITLVTGGMAFATLLTTRLGAMAGSNSLPEVTVYKSPT